MVLGFCGGADPWISAVEVSWPDPTKEPNYACRMSRHKGFLELQVLSADPRIRRGENLPALVAFTDELEATALADVGWAVAWYRPIRGPGAEKEAQVLVNVAELETSMRRLAEQKRIKFPRSLGALGRRVGGELTLEDRELLALGGAVWYAVQTHDRTRSQPKHPKEPLPWDENEIPDPEREGELSDLMDSLATRRHPLSRL